METGPKTTRRKRTCTNSSPRAAAASLACQHHLFGESSFLEQNRVTEATVQRYNFTLNDFLAFFENDDGRAKAVGKVGRDGGGRAGTPVLSRLRTRDGGLLDGSHVRRMASKFPRSSPCCAGSEGQSTVSAGECLGALFHG